MSNREERLNALRAYLMEYMPQTPASERSANFVTKKERVQRLLEQNKKIEEKTRKVVNWRESLAVKLGIKTEDIVKCTNTIIEAIEEILLTGERVSINGFGIIKPIYSERRDQIEIRFDADEMWKRTLNDPIYQTDIGLKKAYKNGKLQRRNI